MGVREGGGRESSLEIVMQFGCSGLQSSTAGKMPSSDDSDSEEESDDDDDADKKPKAKAAGLPPRPAGPPPVVYKR